MSRAKKNPLEADTDPRLVSIIGVLSDEIERWHSVSARKKFISDARKYARQDGFNGEAVFRSFMVYVLIGSRYSALRSVGKSSISKGNRHGSLMTRHHPAWNSENVIERVAKLISQNADRSLLKKAYFAADDIVGSTALDAVNYSMLAAADACSAADASIVSTRGRPEQLARRGAPYAARAVSNAFWSTPYDGDGRTYAIVDYGKGLLKIMKKEAKRARLKKVAKKKSAKKNPKPSWAKSAAIHGLPHTAAWYVQSRIAGGYEILKREDGLILEITEGYPAKGKDLWVLLSSKGGSQIGKTTRSRSLSHTSTNARRQRAAAWADRQAERLGVKSNPKKKATKKKVAKKKAVRKKTPPYQLLISRCRKLWDHYCERPSKKRLKPVLEHLEKMKASTSKKVADERKRCLRVANKEARRLKMK